jgi:altronate dehydratase large subunit
VNEQIKNLEEMVPVPMAISELSIGTVCGGSDGTSGITGNPAVGRAFDWLLDEGSVCIFEETGELIGCEDIMANRAVTPELGQELRASVNKAAHYYAELGYGSFAAGNADGGLYLMDVVPDGEVRFGFPNISDNAEIVEMMASGVHMTLFVTGRGSVVGSAISPVIKIAANPQMYERLSEDMDINAGKILNGDATLDAVGEEIIDLVRKLASGTKSKSEELGHTEFILTYKSFEPIGPACLPV